MNNYLKSWNNSFHQTLVYNYPTTWRLIDHFRDDTALVISHLLQAIYLQAPQKTKHLIYVGKGILIGDFLKKMTPCISLKGHINFCSSSMIFKTDVVLLKFRPTSD